MLVFDFKADINQAYAFAQYVRDNYEMRAEAYARYRQALVINQSILSEAVVVTETPGEELDRPDEDDDDPMPGEISEYTALLKNKAQEFGGKCMEREEED